MSQPLIELKELTKYFDISKNAKLHAVDGITLNINKGETLGVVGESGCGKSTFLKTLNRMNDLVPGVRIEGDVRHRAAASRADLRHDPL